VQSYVSSPGIASKIGCVVHEQLRTIFCLECRRAILPKDVPGHVRAQHNIKMGEADSGNLAELVTTYQLHTTHAEVKYPAPGGPPVEVLEMFPGFACRMCHYCCRTESSIDRHIRGHPIQDRHSPRMSDLRAATNVQTLFSGFAETYFEVNPLLYQSGQFAGHASHPIPDRRNVTHVTGLTRNRRNLQVDYHI
jgi:hypothetical protein